MEPNNNDKKNGLMRDPETGSRIFEFNKKKINYINNQNNEIGNTPNNNNINSNTLTEYENKIMSNMIRNGSNGDEAAIIDLHSKKGYTNNAARQIVSKIRKILNSSKGGKRKTRKNKKTRKTRKNRKNSKNSKNSRN